MNHRNSYSILSPARAGLTVLALATAFLLGAPVAGAQETLLYSANFEGPDGTQPEGWNVLTGSPAFLALSGNQYVADFRFGGDSQTFVSQYQGAGASEWSDYIVETTASYTVAPDSVSNRLVIVSATGRGSSSSAFYTADFWVSNSWPADEGPGGRFRIFRFGGGNSQLAFADNIVPRPVDGLPMPLEMTVTIRLAMIGSTIVATLTDEGTGEVLAELSAHDTVHTAGYPGIRPGLRDGIVRYHSYDVYEPAVPEEPVVAENFRIYEALELEFPTEEQGLYEVQKQLEDESWESVGGRLEGSGEPVRQLASLRETDAESFRVMRSTGTFEEQPSFYETGFEEPDFSTPTGWNLRTGSSAFFYIDGNQYVVDYRFGGDSTTFISAYEGDDALTLTDYMVETKFSYTVAPGAVENWQAFPTLLARVGAGPSAYYMAQFLPTWGPAGEGDLGGVFRIYRIGGGNGPVATASAFLEGAAPLQMAGTIQFTVIGSHLSAALFNESGELLARVSAEDDTHPVGAPGLRPGVRDSIVRFDDFRVFDLSEIALETEVTDVTRHGASEVVYTPPTNYSFRLQETADLVSWEDVGGVVIGDDQEVSVLRSMGDGDRGFFRVLTLD